MLYLILLLNTFRFIGLETSPLGFYVDEVAGATQALCILESGRDFYGDFLPLFFPGVNDAYYTPGYIYGLALWSSIFGKSIFAFRLFIAVVSCLTIFFLYFWVKKESTKKIALYVALAASIMPWSFHFSRIAWDPPVGVFFLIAGLWASSQIKNSLVTASLLSFAAYSYSPLRIAIPLIWVFLPGVTKREKVLVSLWGLILAIPLIIQMQIPEFMARSELRSLWGNYSTNQFRDKNFLELLLIAGDQFLSHFSFKFLFISGDQNIRHSIQAFGELSWLDAFGLAGGFSAFIYLSIKNWGCKYFVHGEKKLITIALLGILANTIPSALTNEGTPHALRSLGSWPFYALLTGIFLNLLSKVLQEKYVLISTILISLLFFGSYQIYFFKTYPTVAKNYFASDKSKINEAFNLISNEGVLCRDVPKEGKPRLPNELVKIKLNKAILFSTNGYGALYLSGGWQEQEPWGIWSKPQGAKLRFTDVPTNARSIVLVLKAVISPSHPRQVLKISLTGEIGENFELHSSIQNVIQIPLGSQLLNTSNEIQIEFSVISPVSPIEAGISNSDNRDLGIGLVSVTFK